MDIIGQNGNEGLHYIIEEGILDDVDDSVLIDSDTLRGDEDEQED